jgi:hypothetical protein
LDGRVSRASYCLLPCHGHFRVALSAIRNYIFSPDLYNKKIADLYEFLTEVGDQAKAYLSRVCDAGTAVCNNIQRQVEDLNRRERGTTTAELLRLADWLHGHQSNACGDGSHGRMIYVPASKISRVLPAKVN